MAEVDPSALQLVEPPTTNIPVTCTFCTEMLTNLPCLPPDIQYFIYGFFVVTSGLILIYIRSACGALASLFRTFFGFYLAFSAFFAHAFALLCEPVHLPAHLPAN